MLKFKLFIDKYESKELSFYECLLDEALHLETVADISKVYDYHWEDPLPSKEEIASGKKASPPHAIFRFNVAGDGCGDESNPNDPCQCHDFPTSDVKTCYKVSFDGYPEDGVSISFTRGDEFIDARLTYTDETGNIVPVGANVFAGIKMALKQYMDNLNPVSIEWKSMPRTSLGLGTAIRTSEEIKKLNLNRAWVRENVYNIWSAKNMFPDKFILVPNASGISSWIKRDVYDDYFVPKGFPPIPKEVTYTITDKFGNNVQKTSVLSSESSVSAKVVAMKQMSDKIKQIENLKNTLETFKKDNKEKNKETRKNKYESKLRGEKISLGKEKSSDLSYNPDRFVVGDLVKLKNAVGVDFFLAGKILSLHMREFDDKLSAEIQFQSKPTNQNFDGKIESVPVKQLKKIENISSDIKNYFTMLADYKQKYKFNIGDKIIYEIDPKDNLKKLLGKINDLFLYRNLDGTIDLKAHIMWDDHARSVLRNNTKKPIDVYNLRAIDKKETEEIFASQRQHGIEKRITKNLKRISPVKIGNEQEAQKMGFSIGDEVDVISGMHKGKKGKILLFKKDPTGLSAQVAPVNMPNFWVKLHLLNKKDSDLSISGSSPATFENRLLNWIIKMR